jgi:hypothetical protein
MALGSLLHGLSDFLGSVDGLQDHVDMIIEIVQKPQRWKRLVRQLLGQFQPAQVQQQQPPTVQTDKDFSERRLGIMIDFIQSLMVELPLCEDVTIDTLLFVTRGTSAPLTSATLQNDFVSLLDSAIIWAGSSIHVLDGETRFPDVLNLLFRIAASLTDPNAMREATSIIDHYVLAHSDDEAAKQALSGLRQKGLRPPISQNIQPTPDYYDEKAPEADGS